MFKLSRKSLIVFILSLCAVLLVLNSLSCFKNPVLGAFKDELSVIGFFKRHILGIIFYNRNMVTAQNLSKEIGGLRWQLSELREVSLENARLKNLLNLKQKSLYRLIPAAVIARSPDSWSSSIVIDKGRSSGINPQMAVINLDGLVGRVIEVYSSASKVLLLNDSSQGVSCIVQRSRQEGLVSGTLGSNLIMRYLPDDAQIEKGDLIITSGLSQVYPKGLAVGQVINIGKDFSGLNRFAVVKPAADLTALEEVLVIIQ